MATTIERLLTAELTTTPGDTSYTADDNTQVQIRACTLVNKTGTPRWVNCLITPDGGSARYVLFEKVITPSQSYAATQVVAQALNPGDKIEFEAEVASAIDLSLSGSITS